MEKQQITYDPIKASHISSEKIQHSQNKSSNPSFKNEKWQKIIEQSKKQEEQTPFLLKQQSFKNSNMLEEYQRQKQMMQQAAQKGRQFLVNKNYEHASKQLSKSLMAFQFIAKNHGQTIEKEQIKQIMLSTVIPAYNNLSLCYLKLKNYELVVSLTNQVLGQDSDNVKARYRRALALKELKKTDEAINDFDMVKKVNSEMENDCNQKIKECRAIEVQQKKKRKLTAQKFLSGYQNANEKDNSNQTNTLLSTQTPKLEEPCQTLTEKATILSWIKEKCQKCSKLLSKLTSSEKKQQKQQ